MPRTPYLPPGTLREVLAYPRAAQDFDAAAYTGALTRLQLDRLLPLLDVSRRWDRELSEDEQQTVAFARTLLHAPAWLLIDEVLDSLDEDARERVVDLLSKDLPRTGIIHIGRADAHDHLFARVLHLVKDPTLRRLVRAGAQSGVPA
jgi:putative ATP-binding cassette transporter